MFFRITKGKNNKTHTTQYRKLTFIVPITMNDTFIWYYKTIFLYLFKSTNSLDFFLSTNYNNIYYCPSYVTLEISRLHNFNNLHFYLVNQRGNVRCLTL